MTRLLLICKECGQQFRQVSPKAEFCSAPCQKEFNNRRAMRGAKLHDLYMAHRFERDEAKRAGLMQVINRLASDWREEDRRQREGRKSWQPFRRILEKEPHLKAVRLGYLRAGR